MTGRGRTPGIGITGRLVALIAATLTVTVGVVVTLMTATTEREFHVFLTSDRPVDTQPGAAAPVLAEQWSDAAVLRATLEREAAETPDALWLVVDGGGGGYWAPSELAVDLTRFSGSREVLITRETPPRRWILRVPEGSGTPIAVAGERVGELHVLNLADRTRMTPETDFLEGNRRAAIWLFGLTVPLALLAAWFVGRRLTRPLRSLAAATGHLSAGELGHQVPVEGGGEIEDLARRFNAMSLTLAEAEQQRRRMVSDIAHELRTPLTGLRCDLELLRDGVTETGPRAIEQLHGEVLELQRLVDDLQMLTLAQSRQLSIEPADCSLLEVAVAARAAVHGEACVDLEIPPELTLATDPRRLRQVLVNLLQNALRYTNENDPIEVSGRVDDVVLIEVQDHGPGVAPAELPRLFDRFYRTDGARSRGSGGSGLGLAICREIVTLLGGRIEASLPSAGGLRISIRLPAPTPTNAQSNCQTG